MRFPAQGTVFCAFNNTFKITPNMWQVWMQILQRTPGNVLVAAGACPT
jgi:predicted O-linked N-acetylglucosamine transferase (SPINDLY family)